MMSNNMLLNAYHSYIFYVVILSFLFVKLKEYGESCVILNEYANLLKGGYDLARKPKQKELQNSRLLKEYASWAYCTACNKTVAYLCYVTYDLFDFEYTCNCGNHGKVYIEFDRSKSVQSDQALIVIKNRLCNIA